MPTRSALLYGAHLSIAGGFDKAIDEAEKLGCTAIQIFTKSNRQWKAREIKPEEATLFQKRWKESEVQSIMVHASYLINIGSSKPQVQAQSIQALADELVRCERLGIKHLVLHPGSHGGDQEQCLEDIAANLDLALEKAGGNTVVLLETMAGQGSSIGHSFEQLATIRKKSAYKKRVGVCLDTCHVFAAGYDIRTLKGYEQMWEDFDAIIGISHLKAIHVNDSKRECGARIDRHEHIGKGAIGLAGFRHLFNDARFFDIPKILETPKDHETDDAANLKTVRTLLSAATRKALGYTD